jgi:quinol monooxygenase YgiN
MTVHVLAMITAKPGQRAPILAAFAENRPNVLAETGCIAYEATVDLPDVGQAQRDTAVYFEGNRHLEEMSFI